MKPSIFDLEQPAPSLTHMEERTVAPLIWNIIHEHLAAVLKDLGPTRLTVPVEWKK